jgi:RNA polymerase-binding transcription factor DksA
MELSDISKQPRLCNKCHLLIPEVRLEVLPDATMCVKCAEKFGQQPRSARLEPDPDAPHPRGW